MSLTVGQFLEAGAGELDLRRVDETASLDRPVPEHALNRPGLALTGFLRYFAHRRIQVFGLAEMTYLKGLSAGERRDRLRTFFAQRVPCVVIARNLRPFRDMETLARDARTPLLRSRLVTSEFLQRGAVLIADLVAPAVRVQGTMVDLMGIGVLIEGEPGIGKSETALSLIARGFSLVSDDLTVLRRLSSGVIMASAPESTRYHMEIRGVGIVHVPSLYGVAAVRQSKRLDMVVRLEPCPPGAPCERAGGEITSRDVLGVEIPCMRIPVAPGRDATHIVEAAALNYRLRVLGHDAAKELDLKLMERLARERRGNRGD